MNGETDKSGRKERTLSQKDRVIVLAQIFTINPFVADVLHDLRDGRPVVYSEDLPTQMRQKRAVAGFIGASEEMRTEIMAAILLHEQWEEAAEQREAEKQLEWD